MAVTIPTKYHRIYDKGGVTCYLEFPKALENELEARFGDGSDFQMFWANMLLSDINNYVPIDRAVLRNTAIIAEGGGVLIWTQIYSRYLYHGKLMVDPITGKGAFYSEGFGFWSRPGVPKVPDPAGRELKFHGGGNAGPEWDVRAARDLMPKWIAAQQAWLDSRR